MLKYNRTKSEIVSNKEFDQLYARRDFRKFENIIFYAFIFTIVSTISIIFGIKAYEYKDYDESKTKLNQAQQNRFYYLLEQAYGETDRSEVIARREEIRRRRELQRVEEQKQIQEEVKRLLKQQEASQILSEADQQLVDEIAVITTDFKLAELDEFDDILANFSDAYKRDSKKELELSRSVRESRISRNREIRAYLLRPDAQKKDLVNFGEIKEKERDFYQGFRTEKEIKQINKVMRKNEFLLENCIKRYQMNHPEEKGYFKFQFRIDSTGNIKKESIEILESNLKSNELKECVIRRIKHIRGFGHASMRNANDYIYRKKWILN